LAILTLPENSKDNFVKFGANYMERGRCTFFSCNSSYLRNGER